MKMTKKLCLLILGGLLVTGGGAGLGISNFNIANAGNVATFTEIISVDNLYVGATYIISGLKDSVTHVMTTTQESHNRPSEIAVLSEGKIVDSSTIQKFKLVVGNKNGTYGFEALNGPTTGQYIYASSSSYNYLNSEATLSDNSSWAISFTHGELSVAAQGGNTNNILRFNGISNPPTFSSYKSGQSPISLHIDETSIPLVKFGTLDRIALNTDNAKTSFFVDDEFTSNNIIVIAYDTVNTYKIIMTYEIDTADGYKFVQTDKGAFKVTIAVTLNDVTRTASYYVEVKTAKLFAKVTSQTRVKVDKVYTLATSAAAASTSVTSSISEVSIIYDDSNSTFKEVADLQTFKLVTGSKANSYAFKLLNGPNIDKYYGYSSGGDLAISNEVTNSSSWYITISDGAMNITNASNENIILVYDYLLGAFAVSTSGVSAILYEATTIDIVTVDIFVSDYMYPKTSSGSECTGDCITKAYYESVKKAFNALTSTQRNLFVIGEDYKVPLATLTSWARANGDVLNVYTNILESSSSANPNTNVLNDGNTIMLIVIISLISVSILGGAFYLRKKEKK